MSRKINMNDMPYKSDSFGFVLGYDYRLHKWIYDVKFFLIDNNWCFDQEGKDIIREIDERELKAIERHKDIIEKHERENAAWLNHKQCRKRNCICKKCKKYCHCYNCVEKIGKCDDFTQEER